MSKAADEICSTLKINDVMEFYGVKFNSKGFANCPFHKEKTAGFQTIDLNQYANRMVSELNAFAQMFNAGDYDTCYRNLDHSLSVMHVLTDARNKAGISFL